MCGEREGGREKFVHLIVFKPHWLNCVVRIVREGGGAKKNFIKHWDHDISGSDFASQWMMREELERTPSWLWR